MIALDYHENTKHHFNRFARSAGYLDWATQPNPFRYYDGAPRVDLPREPLLAGETMAALFEGRPGPTPVTLHSVAEFLRCSMGLSAWKQYQTSRWALRVNPSSGNLHPTEAYIVWNGRVQHYAPFDHAVEERCVLGRALAADGVKSGWDRVDGEMFLVGLTSVFWREAWKYGERAFRYCQHDLGHAIGALRLSASRLGWRLALMPRWSDADIDALLGLDRDADFGQAEREAAGCVAVVTPTDPALWLSLDPAGLVAAARAGMWQGQANRLSPRCVDWPAIDDVAWATRYTGRGGGSNPPPAPGRCPGARRDGSSDPPPPLSPGTGTGASEDAPLPAPPPSGRALILQRRSAVAFDARSQLPATSFFEMLARLRPSGSPWDAIDWPPQVHLALFVHRVDGLSPGLYAFLRDVAVAEEWRAAMRPEFLWEPSSDTDPCGLFLLAPLDVTWPAARVSCDQDIAGDGFFSFGMIARLEPSLRERGESFYRRLFWECGLIGQVCYLTAEAAGARATGIGCFYDDAVHDVFGLAGRTWQSLYHFSAGIPVEDGRLSTELGYPWER
jgi:SagB-type dehydrogenase family enzyme